MTDREQEVYRVAQELFQQAPDWVTFFRAVLGVGGLVRESFKNPEELASFEQSETFAELQHMVARLRASNGDLPSPKEPTRVITVRLPQSLHESLRLEAHDRRTSMNKLCISKLLQMVDAELIPTDSTPKAMETQNTKVGADA
jgi:predicted HicB family RNase H-like nuclease